MHAGKREDHRSRALGDDVGIGTVERDAQLERAPRVGDVAIARGTCRAGRRRSKRLRDDPRTYVPMRLGRCDAPGTLGLPPLGDWCIGNTAVSKTATPGSIPGSPAWRRPRRSSRPTRSPGASCSSPAAGRTSAGRRRSSSRRPGRRWSSPGGARRCSRRRPREIGERCSFVAGDIREPADATRIVETVRERHGRLDVLVNNAGGQYFVPAEEIAAEGLAGGPAAERRRHLHDDPRRGRAPASATTAARSSTSPSRRTTACRRWRTPAPRARRSRSSRASSPPSGRSAASPSSPPPSGASTPSRCASTPRSCGRGAARSVPLQRLGDDAGVRLARRAARRPARPRAERLGRHPRRRAPTTGSARGRRRR